MPLIGILDIISAQYVWDTYAKDRIDLERAEIQALATTASTTGTTADTPTSQEFQAQSQLMSPCLASIIVISIVYLVTFTSLTLYPTLCNVYMFLIIR